MKTGYLDQHIEVHGNEVEVIYSIVDGPIVEISDRKLFALGYLEMPRHIKSHNLFLIAKNKGLFVYISYSPKTNLFYLAPYLLYRLANGFQERLLWTLIIWNLWPRGKITEYPKWRFWK